MAAVGKGKGTASTEAIRAAAKVAEARGDAGERGLVTLSNGVVLKCSPIPPLLLRLAGSEIEAPAVPTFLNEAKGREEENPEDPDYKRALLDHRLRVGDAAMNIMLAVGTSIEHIPDGVSKPEDDDWIDTLKSAGISVEHATPKARYISWLRMYAVATTEDLNSLTRAVGETASVKEEDVALAAESFPGEEARGADSQPTVASSGRDGRDVHPSPRRARRGNRRA
jgi:hypothetical protein